MDNNRDNREIFKKMENEIDRLQDLIKLLKKQVESKQYECDMYKKALREIGVQLSKSEVEKVNPRNPASIRTQFVHIYYNETIGIQKEIDDKIKIITDLMLSRHWEERL